MDVRVANHQVETGQSLRDHAQQRVAEVTEKYFARSVGANVTFEPGPNNEFSCNIIAPVAQGLVLKATHSGREPEIAFNGALDRIEKQLRRYASRLKEHRGTGDDPQQFVENASYTIFSRREAEEEEQASFPAVIAETRVDVPETSVSDAVMLMDLRNTTALMFKNSGTGELNMVYRREDGNIGWVEPRES